MRYVALLLVAACTATAPQNNDLESTVTADTAPTPSAKPALTEPLAAVKDGVACGDEVCSKGPCCMSRDDAKIVQPKGECGVAADQCAPPNMKVACDDSGDCPSGQACCSSFDEALDHFLACGPLPCAKGPEVCHAQAPCKEGYACTPTDNWPGMSCVYEKSSVECGKVKCSGQTPVCHWDGDKKEGKCIARADAAMGDVACDDHDDCGKGNLCMVPMGGTYCSAPEAYDQSFMNVSIICKTDKDCPMAAMTVKMVCRNRPELPPKLKACIAP